jgi:hypothetical protein
MKANNIIAIKILDLLEQIEAVDRLLAMYAKEENDGIMASMIRQHSIRKQEFVDKLNLIFNKYSLAIVNSKPISSPTVSKEYEVDSLVLEGVSEPKGDL